MNEIHIPENFAGLFEPHRFKVFYGGRDGAKSWSFAEALLHLGARKPLRIVCAREFQNSIDESVKFLLEKKIGITGLPYEIEKYRLYNAIGTEFIFKGLSKQDAAAIKSLEGADIVWVEEAQNVSEGSWKNLIPTVRKDGSEIWVSFNPDIEDAPTYQRFVVNPPPDTLTVLTNFTDNPWPSKVLAPEREHMRRTDYASYENVWLGKPKKFSEGAYFREQIEELEKAGRIGDVPHDPSRPVWTFWDLGWDDSTAIWFVQITDTGTFNIIDYVELSNVALPKIVKEEFFDKRSQYRFAGHFIPHDGGHGNRQTGKSDQDILHDAGLKDVEVMERTDDKDRDVNNIRVTLPKCRFDKVKTQPGMGALRGYRQEKDLKTGLWRFKHDWTSHGTDAFRSFSVAQIDGLIKVAVTASTRSRGTGSVWTR
ncbi:PBSX family phage terminase large subunit [Rhizobium leguminosarum bv. viciae]|uniref:PBSX family phage terminase large subunit n=1 Tax=Rhizobium TaxID=379 RepID=UPI001441A3FE|nr:PBSX family phage terminase large subunit [Rhizobium leguminosarum bv. viciae]